MNWAGIVPQNQKMQVSIKNWVSINDLRSVNFAVEKKYFGSWDLKVAEYLAMGRHFLTSISLALCIMIVSLFQVEKWLAG